MKRIRVIAALLAAAIALPALGDQQSAMLINLNNGGSTSTALSEIAKVTVSGGNVVVAKTDGTTSSTAISSIYNITFDVSTGSGVTLSTSASDPYAGPVEVYAIDGRLVMSTTVEAGQAVSLDQFENGIYIIRTGEKAIKVRKQ